MKIKKITLCFFALLNLSLFAQQDTVSRMKVAFLFGKNASSFIFKDSLGAKNKDLSNTMGDFYGLNLQIRLKKRHLLVPEFAYYNAGSNYKKEGLELTWRLNYVGFGLGYAFKIIDTKNYSMAPKIAIGYDYLLKQNQTIGSQTYDLTQTNAAFINYNIRSSYGITNQFKITDNLSFIAEYRYSIGLNQIENSRLNSIKTTKNTSNTFIAGLLFKI
jgi:hypothetical protein